MQRSIPLLLSLLLAAGPALAAVSKADQAFFTRAAGGGMFEVVAGKLAESRGTDPAVNPSAACW